MLGANDRLASELRERFARERLPVQAVPARGVEADPRGLDPRALVTLSAHAMESERSDIKLPADCAPRFRAERCSDPRVLRALLEIHLQLADEFAMRPGGPTCQAVVAELKALHTILASNAVVAQDDSEGLESLSAYIRDLCRG